MKRLRFPYLFITTGMLLFFFFHFVPVAFGQGSFSRGKIYIISIGINKNFYRIDGKLREASNKFCENDAEKLTNWLTAPSILKKDSGASARILYSVYDSQSIKKITGTKFQPGQDFRSAPLKLVSGETGKDQAIVYDSIISYTLKKPVYKDVEELFINLNRKVVPQDIFIFYYAGISNQTKNKEFGQLSFFPLADTVYLDSAGELKNYNNIITSLTLKNWFNKLQAKNQLVIFDATNGERFFPSFMSVAFEKDPLAASVSERNRSFIYNIDMGYEHSAIGGGLLTYNLVRMNQEWLRMIFSADQASRERARGSFVKQQINAFKENELRASVSSISFEKDYIDFIKTMELGSASRGAEKLQQSKKKSFAAVKNYALLIATDEYKDPSWKKLSNPVNDATTMEKELRENYGFVTELLKNPTRREVLETIRKYKTAMRYDSASQLMIFIAGHGGYDSFVNGFIATSDSRSLDDDPLRDSYIAHSQLRDIINTIECNHILVVLDVCFGGTFDEKLTSSAGRGNDIYKDVDKTAFIERKLKYRSRLYLTSGGKEYVPDGRPGMHSPFAFRLIDALRNRSDELGIISFDKLKTAVEKVVPEPRAGMFGSGEPGGDFIFIAQ